MKHLDLLKRAFSITWRYRSLWLFGFLLALCSGGNGGGNNINIPDDGAGFEELESLPGLTSIDYNLIVTLIIAFICLILVLAILGVVVRAVTRTALMGMVRQIAGAETPTIGDGWSWGWSSRAWRLFLLGLAVGIPVAVVSLVLISLALAPLLLLLVDNTALTILAIAVTVLAFLLVLLVIIAIGAVTSLVQELAWRRTVLDGQGVISSLGDAVKLIRSRLKDVAVLWLIMVGVGLAWGVLALVVVLPLALVAALLVGGIPGGLVYLLSNSWLGAAVTGVPLAVLALILVTSVATGFYLIFQSTVWTLAYLEFQTAESLDASPSAGPPLLSSAPQAEA